MVKEHPLVQVNNATVSSDIINLMVTLLENGLPTCTLTASDDRGKNFLSTFKLYDDITVKFAYEEDNPNWDNIEPTFKGKIMEISPSLTSSGETLSITAIQGECLKQMRVASEYGSKVHYITYNHTVYVDEFTNETSQWEKFGNSPYLMDSITDGIGLEVSNDSLGKFDYGYKTVDIPIRQNMVLDTFKIQLCVTGEHFWTGENPTVVYIKVSIYDGVNWKHPSPVQIPNDHEVWIEVDVKGYLDPTRFNNYKVKITFYSIDGVRQGSVYIWKLRFYLSGYGYDSTDPYLRAILTDTTKGGLVPFYIEKILGSNESSKYTLNTDYIYNDTLEFPYINFPYQDAYMCIQDLIRYGTTLHYTNNPSNWTGLHWIILPDNTSDYKLVIAPVGNHNVYGKDSNYLIENIWKTWVHGETNYTITVREDMIVQNFKHEIPLANYVLVAGKLIKPDDEVWTDSTDNWYAYSSPVENSASVSLNTSFKVVGKGSINMHIACSGAILKGLFLRSTEESLDFKKLVSRDNSVKFRFKFAIGGYVSDVYLVVATDNSHYVMYPLTNLEQDNFVECAVELKQGVIDNINLKGDSYDKWIASVDPPNWSNINFVGFRFQNSQMVDAVDCRVDDLLLEANLIRGAYTLDCGQQSKDNCKIGCIKHFGCRFLTIKDSLAHVTTVSTDNAYDNKPLPALALYELLRNRIPKTTGQIQIALDKDIMAGQYVWIKACYDESNNTYRIDRTFRIHEVRHTFSSRGATTTLTLSDDLKNSIPVNTLDPYSILMRVVNPDYQTRTWASLKISGGQFSSLHKPISKNYPQ